MPHFTRLPNNNHFHARYSKDMGMPVVISIPVAFAPPAVATRRSLLSFACVPYPTPTSSAPALPLPHYAAAATLLPAVRAYAPIRILRTTPLRTSAPMVTLSARPRIVRRTPEWTTCREDGRFSVMDRIGGDNDSGRAGNAACSRRYAVYACPYRTACTGGTVVRRRTCGDNGSACILPPS